MKQLLSYLHPLNRLERKRIKYVNQEHLPEAVATLLSVPYAGAKAKLTELDFLVLDLETSGVDPEVDHILSIGYVEITSLCLHLSSSFHTFVQSENGINPKAAVVNHIVPAMLREGLALDAAMDRLFQAMIGKVMISHGTVIEKNFIDCYVKHRYGLDPLPVLWLDTMLIEKSLFCNRDQCSDYRLASVRKRHNLPPYLAHNALADSIAAGELFMALVKNTFGNTTPILGGVFHDIV
jgi:DNA polymerase-3 subunit epsilon